MNVNEKLRTVMTFREAVELIGRNKVQTMIRSGRWQQPCRGIYVTHNGVITPDERDLIALKVCGRGAALAGLSALKHDGFKGFDAAVPTVVQPAGSSAPPYEDVDPHWSIWLDDRDVHPDREPRRTRPQRSLVDAASWATSDRYARVIIIAGVQQGIVTTKMLRESLVRRGACRHRAIIVQSILDAHGGIQSLPERDFNEICRRLRLPKPSRQVPCKGRDGRYYLDVEWKEYAIAVEIHGIPHLRIRDWDGDLERGNEITILDKRLLIFSSYTIRHRQERVGDQVIRMLRSRGWNPSKRIEVIGV
ncbi:MAG: hypothetical protein H7288_20000 [Kineosporiaceae bacterium]|nr:hypothetical protein [Aeromicrobium sp.]